MLRHRLTIGPLLILGLLLVFWLDGWLDHVELTGFLKQLFLGRDYFPSGLALFALGLVVLPPAAWELARIFRANHIMASLRMTCFAAVFGYVIHFAIPHTTQPLSAVAVVCTGLVLMFVFSLTWYSRDQNVEGVVAAAGGTMFAMIYLGFMLGFLLAIRRWNSPWIIVAVVLTTKSCDIGAYFTGRWFGKHKLIEWLSPGKTWEGLIGGLVTSTVVALALAWWGRMLDPLVLENGQMIAMGFEVRAGLRYPLHFNPIMAGAAGFLFGLTGQAGDLTASLLKRDAGIKDSSHVIPGFGGVLDVLDSPLLVAPLAYWILRLAG